MNQAINRPLVQQPAPAPGPVPSTNGAQSIQQQNPGLTTSNPVGVVPGATSPQQGAEVALGPTTPPTTEQAPMEPQGPIGAALWKPMSESDGNLVVLFPYRAGTVVIKDANTGEIIDTGRSTGPSNGYGDTIRFSRPGAAYREVIVEDSLGNAIYIKDGSQRIENIEVRGGTGQTTSPFPSVGTVTMPTIPTFDPIPVPKKKKVNYPKTELPLSTFKTSKAPTTDRPDVPSKGISEFSKEFSKQRGR